MFEHKFNCSCIFFGFKIYSFNMETSLKIYITILIVAQIFRLLSFFSIWVESLFLNDQVFSGSFTYIDINNIFYCRLSVFVFIPNCIWLSDSKFLLPRKPKHGQHSDWTSKSREARTLVWWNFIAIQG